MYQILKIVKIKVGEKAMQEENKNLGMLKILTFGREILTLSPVAYITAVF